MTDMELSSVRSLNSLSVVSNISSGIQFFEDIFFWERLKFDWVSNLNSFNDFAFTFLDDEPDVVLLAHSDVNMLRHLVSHWRDLAGRHPDVERLTAAEYKLLYYESLKCSSNLWDFLQLELMRTDDGGGRAALRRSQSYPQTATRQRQYRSVAVSDEAQSMAQSMGQFTGLQQRRHGLHRHRHRSVDGADETEPPAAHGTANGPATGPANGGAAAAKGGPRDGATIELVDFLDGLNQNLALYLLIEGPKTIPPQFRNVYKNLIQILCKTHGSFLPTIMQMKKDDRLRPIEYEGYWESDSTCNVCFQTHGAFIKRCCDVVVCESCFTQYINHQIHSLNRIHVECPATNCQRPIRFQSIWIRLSESNRIIYERIKNNQLQTDTRKLCPHCMQFYELSDEEKERLSKKKYKKLHKKGFNVRCRLCHWEWCFKCQTPMHNVTCKKNLSTDKLLMKWANSRAESVQASVKKARKCPKCHILVERNGGCPHMECSKCKCSWCYDCGHRRIKIKHLPFVNHDSRFFILGCSKNLLANKPHLRRFVRICVFCGVSVLIIPASAIAGVLLVALGILLGLPFGCYMLALKMRQCSCSK